MTVKELREKILSNGGDFTVGKARITHEKDKDIDVFDINRNVVCWISSAKEEDAAVLKSITTGGEYFTEDKLSAIIDFAQYLGVKVGVEPITVEKEVVRKENEFLIDVAKEAERSKLQGAVEAYEKLLIGRDITISK